MGGDLQLGGRYERVRPLAAVYGTEDGAMFGQEGQPEEGVVASRAAETLL